MRVLFRLAARVRWQHAVVFLFVLSFVLSGGAYLSAVAYYHRSQAAEQHQGAVLEGRLCATLARQAELKPPPLDSPADLSRAYLQGQHAVLAELGPDVGCTRR